MATSTKAGGKKKAPVAPENQTPSEAIAAAVMAQYGDLKPSVERIMNADLGEQGKMQAITLFRESLGVPGDVHRDPAQAIEAGRLADAAAPAQ